MERLRMGYGPRATQPAGEPGERRTQSTLYFRKDNEKHDTHSSLAVVLQSYLELSGRSIYQVSNMSGVDSAYIWRIVKGKRQNVSREVLLLLSVALAVESDQAQKVVEVASNLFEAAGFRAI